MSSPRSSFLSRVLFHLRRPVVVGGGTLLLVGLFVLWWKVGNLYPVKGLLKQWREDKFTKIAAEQVGEKKYNEAATTLQRLILSNPNNPDLWKLRLKVAEGQDDKRALAGSLYNIVRITPTDLESRLRLVKLLSGERDLKNAAEVLSGATGDQANRPEVLRLAGELAIANYDLPLAERKFSALLKALPDDKGAKFNLAAIALNRNDLINFNESRDILRGFVRDPEFHLPALRLLLAAAIRSNDAADIRRLTQSLATEQGLTFADRVLLLSGQRLVAPPAYERTLEELKKEAETEAEKAMQLANFFTRNRLFTDAEKFLGSLPPEMASRPELSYALSDVLFYAKDWTTLEEKLRSANWERIEYMRLAFLAYAYRAQGKEKEFEETWNLAVIGADPVPANVRNLLQQAAKWNWRNEVTNLLWKIFQRDPSDTAVYDQLRDAVAAAGNTASLQRVFARRLEANPKDNEAKNNAAYLSLLLGTGVSQAHRQAREVYEAEPTNTYFITVHAVSLLKQRQAAEALKVFEAIAPEQRVAPARALHYAAILIANKRTAAAKDALAKVSLVRALPEEKALYEQTKQAIAEAAP